MKKLVSMALALVMALALAVPAAAATVESNFRESYSYSDEYGNDHEGYVWYGLEMEMDQEPISVTLPWTTLKDMPVFYVPSGTRILSSVASEKYPDDDDWHLTVDANELVIYGYYAPDGTWITDEELFNMFGMEYNEGYLPATPFTLTREGTYYIRVIGCSHIACLHVVAPGSEYSKTVLAQPNGLEAKIDAYKITAESTVTYQGKEIPLYTVTPGSSDDRNLYLKQVDGASYVVNTYNAKNSGGVLTEIEDSHNYEFIGEEGYYYSWWLSGTDVSVFEIAENGVVIQTLALLVDDNGTAKPDAPGSYTVKKGDTWSSICINFYGDNAQRYALIKANKNVALKEGTVITLPETLGKYTLISAPVAGEGEVLYTVKAGDTLSSIAIAQYGNFLAYKDIFERNSDRLKNANTIYEGQVIVLPAR